MIKREVVKNVGIEHTQNKNSFLLGNINNNIRKEKTMSATNRGSKRIESDFYATPEKTIHRFLTAYDCDMNGLNIFEPCAGKGAICKVIKEKYPRSKIEANEIREEEVDALSQYCEEVHCADFRDCLILRDQDIIITNPPYSIAEEIIKTCFKVRDDKTVVIMLLRTAFLESKKRYDFWQKHPVNHLYVLSERPSFTGKGTDATSYSFFVWDGSNKQSIHVI